MLDNLRKYVYNIGKIKLEKEQSMKTPTTVYVDSHTSIIFESKAAAKRWQVKQNQIKKQNKEALKKLRLITIS